MIELFVDPFLNHPVLQRAFLASIMIAISSGMVGVFLVMRRMSLVGDALSHGILPGIALGFMFYGFNLIAMGIGGVLAGIVIALCAYIVSKFTRINEDASFAAFYLISLAVGVILIYNIGSQVDLIHILFGSVLSVNHNMLIFLFALMAITLIVLAIIYRPLVMFIVDPIFLANLRIKGTYFYSAFLFLVVINLIAGFQALGSLMAVGLLMLPAIISQLWARTLEGMLFVVIIIGFLVSYFGLLLSYYYDIPSGPSIIGTAGVLFIFSLIFGRFGFVMKLLHLKHRAA